MTKIKFSKKNKIFFLIKIEPIFNETLNVTDPNFLADVYVKASDMEDAEPEVVKALLLYIVKVLNFVEDNLSDQNKVDRAAIDYCSALKDKLTLSLKMNPEIVEETFNTADAIENCLTDAKKSKALAKNLKQSTDKLRIWISSAQLLSSNQLVNDVSSNISNGNLKFSFNYNV